jgi:hypothetical protein
MSTRMKIIIGSSVIVAASLLATLVIQLGDREDSHAFSSGEYRSAGSGTWEETETWEVFDGTEWIPAAIPPRADARKIIITTGQQVVITDEMVISHLEIQPGALLDIQANNIRLVKRNGASGLVCNGTIDFNDGVMEGDGDVQFGSSAEIRIGSGEGIDKKGTSGNIQTKGKRDFQKGVTYVFNGSIRQVTGNGLPSTVHHLIIDNPYNVVLKSDISVTERMELRRGTLYTSGNGIVLGTSSSSIAKLLVTGGSFCGRFKRWYNLDTDSSLEFPVSDGSVRKMVSFNSAVSNFRKGMLEIYFKPGIPDDSKRSPYEVRHVVVCILGKGFYSASLSNGAEDGWLAYKPASGNNTDQLSWSITGTDSKASEEHQSARPQSFTNLLTGPDPFHDLLVVRFHSTISGTAHVSLVGTGKVISTQKVSLVTGYNQVNFQVSPDLPEGDYTLQISTTTDINTLRFTKRHPGVTPL